MKIIKLLSVIGLSVYLAGCMVSKVPQVITNPDGTQSTNLVYAPAPIVGTITSGAATVAPIIPAPFGSGLTIAASLLGVVVSSYVAYRNKKNANTWQGVAETIIEGVEALGPTAAEVKKVIKDTSIKNGTADSVHAAVQETV